MTVHIVVSGCARFYGSHVTDKLLRDGYATVGIDWLEYCPRTIKEAESVPASDHAVFKKPRDA